MKDCDVLIAGAGPTGLVLALWLTKMGVKVRIIDRTDGPGTTSRAMAVQSRTLELYRQLDLAQAVVDAGFPVRGVNLWVQGKKAARVSFEKVGSDLTPFGFMHIFPQDQHEQLLVARLEAMGITVERNTELAAFSESPDGIVARLKTTAGDETPCHARFIAGCDGAGSTVRKTIDIGFPGGTYERTFYVADVEASGEAINGELNVDLDQADFVAIFPMKGDHRGRLVGTVKQATSEQHEALTFEDISHRAIDSLKLDIRKVNWFSTYKVHHRVANHFRRGRAFLLGDAAHVHSPAGGQGMNTGIGDAINLAWKLAVVLAGNAPETLLDSYEAERAPFARRLVATTDRIFGFVSADGAIADALRTRIAPVLVPRLFKREFAQDFLFRMVSQIALNYRDGPLSKGHAGHVHSGDRLPWVSVSGVDNHASLSATLWQVHVYGTPSTGVTRWCETHDTPLHVFAWRPEYEAAGLTRDTTYLLRPDTYVAMVDSTGSSPCLDRYLSETGLDRLNHALEH